VGAAPPTLAPKPKTSSLLERAAGDGAITDAEGLERAYAQGDAYPEDGFRNKCYGYGLNRPPNRPQIVPESSPPTLAHNFRKTHVLKHQMRNLLHRRKRHIAFRRLFFWMSPSTKCEMYYIDETAISHFGGCFFWISPDPTM
jgi:hypothetical protein